MKLSEALDEALDDRAGQSGTVEIEDGDARASVDVADCGRLGVKVRGVKVRRGRARDIEQTARELPERLRSLPERVEPVEVDPRLGGATLRSKPEDMQGGEFFQVDVEGERDVEVKRYRARDEGGREPVDWTMTRDQLGRLVDELEE